MNLTKKEARHFLIAYQGLDRFHYKTKGSEDTRGGILSIVKQLGCLQYDPLNVVGRNPDLVLQSRIRYHRPENLDKLLYDERKLIDGWDKMLSIYRTEDFPKFNRVREARGQERARGLKNQGNEKALILTDEVIHYLKEHGPSLASKIDFGSGGNDSWGHRNLSSATLDYLFLLGQVGVYSKNNTQKVYDLISNLLTEDLINHEDYHSPFQNQEAFMDWYVYRRINSLGLLWQRNGGGWLGQFIDKKALREKSLKRLLKKKQIIKCHIEGFEDSFYMTQDGLTLYNELLSKKAGTKNVRFLAPLDNLMWDRDMIESLFGFKYRWEVYTPVTKRVYGYYVLPVIYGHDFIGRIEFEQQRGTEPLVIKHWWWEDKIKPSKTMLSAIDRALKQFAYYRQTDIIINKDLIHPSFK